MFKELLESLRAQLLGKLVDTGVELFFRDISQYKYISQRPVVVVQFKGADLENPPHSSVLAQKGALQICFYYFIRTGDNAFADGIFELFEDIRSLSGVAVQSMRAYNYRKNVSVWEFKATITEVI